MKTIRHTLSLMFLIVVIIACDEETTYDQFVSDGWTSLQNGNYAAAASNFQDAIDLDNSLAQAYLGLGLTQMIDTDINTGITTLTTALEKDGDEWIPGVYAARAFGYNALGQWTNSNNDIAQVIALDPDWSLTKGVTLTITNVRAAQAQNFFSLQNYTAALTAVQTINNAFTLDLQATGALTTLANEIESYNPNFL